MLATVKLVLDSDGNFDDNSPNNPGYHFDDNQNFTPKGTTDNPVVNKLIAVLWADKEPYRKENWDQFHVDLTQWSGRVLPKLAITHDPTHLPGWCTNMGDGTEADYVLESEGLPKEFNPDGTVRLDLGCYDYGGLDKIMYGFIRPGDNKAIVYPIVRVPIDNDGDGMADAWERGNGGISIKPDDDLDIDPPGDKTKGDGLAAFDEYRGFWAVARDGIPYHRSAYPTKKDVFVRNVNSLDISTFREQTKLDVWEIEENGWTTTGELRVINKNRRDQNAPIQKGIRLREGDCEEDLTGCASSVNIPCRLPSFRWIPIGVEYCQIDRAAIRDWLRDPVGDLPSAIKFQVAHELGHAVGMLDRYGTYRDPRIQPPENPIKPCGNLSIMGYLPKSNIPLTYIAICAPTDLPRIGCVCTRTTTGNQPPDDLKAGNEYDSTGEMILRCPP